MAKNKRRKIHIGILEKNRRGFGFVKCDELEKDIFISAASMNGAMNGDEVEVDLIPEHLWKDSPEGIITNVLKRNTVEVAGTFEKSKKFGFVVPESRRQKEDIFVRKKDFSGAKKGDKVVVHITKYPDRKNSAEGRITEIISRFGQPGGDIKTLARSYGIRNTFPSRVSAEAKAVKKKGIREKDLSGRKDLRKMKIFTIDGKDSKDFDDAVSIRVLENGNYLLGVHIADVAHYVPEGGALDKEAAKRGTSIYLIDYVMPMLPKALSNDICSLNPHEDRLTVSVDMEITKEGVMVNHEIYESVINSSHRLIYDEVSDILEDRDINLSERYRDVKNELLLMKNLAQVLRKNREERGSLDFDLDEPRIELDEKGIPVSIELASRRVANKIIEEFMLLANETVAEHFFWMETPFIYRVHEKPTLDKIEKLKVFLQSFGINLKGGEGNIHLKALSGVLEEVKGKNNENIVNTVILRSMQKAYYSTSCEGHFGLAMKYYCHFTSPIRRYPDLMIHRIIKAAIRNELDSERENLFATCAENAAKTSSDAERKAIDLEREVEKMKKAEYMSYHLGERFKGTISGITAFGMYVQLDNTVEGFIRIDSLYDDYYDHIDEKYMLLGRHTNKKYKLGDPLDIIVEDVDTYRNEIDFIVAELK